MTPLQTTMDLDTFMAWSNDRAGRYEYVRGAVRRLPEADRAHDGLVRNVVAALKLRARQRYCRVLSRPASLLTADGDVLLPDVFATCEAGLDRPCLIVEVLSPQTAAADLGWKFTLYRRFASLREYLLVDPEAGELQLYRRGADGRFALHELDGASSLTLESLGCELVRDELFEGVALAA